MPRRNERSTQLLGARAAKQSAIDSDDFRSQDEEQRIHGDRNPIEDLNKTDEEQHVPYSA